MENEMINMYETAIYMCENEFDEIENAIRRIVELRYVGKNEGLFALENYMDSCEEFEEKRFLQNAVTHVVDAIQWEDLEPILSNRILVMENGKKQYLCLIYKEGIKIIQRDVWDAFANASIISLFPEEYEEKILKCLDEISEKEADKWYQKRVIEVTEKYHNLDNTLQALFSSEMKLFETEVLTLSDNKSIQEWLRQVEYYDVAFLMMVGSNEFREAMLSNMSSRLGIEVMDQVVKFTNEYKNAQLTEVRELIRNIMKNISLKSM